MFKRLQMLSGITNSILTDIDLIAQRLSKINGILQEREKRLLQEEQRCIVNITYRIAPAEPVKVNIGQTKKFVETEPRRTISGTLAQSIVIPYGTTARVEFIPQYPLLLDTILCTPPFIIRSITSGRDYLMACAGLEGRWFELGGHEHVIGNLIAVEVKNP